MNILLTGASGLVGTHLIPLLIANGHRVKTLSRSRISNPAIESYLWNINNGFVEEGAFESIDAIIHLAGENVGEKRWTDTQKRNLYSSRIESSKLLKKYCEEKGLSLSHFISASGISYYGTVTQREPFVESDKPGTDFLAQLSVDWEQAADEFNNIANKVIKLRISMVLSKDGGAVQKIANTMNFGPAVVMGSGAQWMPWIHIDDLNGIILHALSHSVPSGSYNMLSDEIPNNSMFMEELGKLKKRPRIYLPKFLIKLILGEMSCILLEGSPASNHKIKDTGYKFKYSYFSEALKTCF